MQALAISANRRYLAVSERGEKGTITVYDLQHEQSRKRKVLSGGDVAVQEFVCMAFSPDSKYLIGQAGGPDWILFYWMWEKQKVMATVKATGVSNPINQVLLTKLPTNRHTHTHVAQTALYLHCFRLNRSASTLMTTHRYA